MLTDGCWRGITAVQLRWLSGAGTAGVPRRTGRRFRWVIEWPQGCPHECTVFQHVMGRGAERRCGRRMRQPAEDGRRGVQDAQQRSFSHEWSRGARAIVCRGSFSAFCFSAFSRKVPDRKLASESNEAKIVWMQESYLSLPVFSS